jgi:ribosome-binding factor A
MLRVEALMHREVASILRFGELRDPRVSGVASISITGVSVSADLSHAKVFVDVMGDDREVANVMAGLEASQTAVRSLVGGRIKLRKTPAIRFFRDESIERGHRIEQVLAELRDEKTPRDADFKQATEVETKGVTVDEGEG